ncbi:MAG: hypothetical protein HN926_05480 [Chloroflexi bacterium]|nr:hypothetical protein [Chloroflexota bacterium]
MSKCLRWGEILGVALLVIIVAVLRLVISFMILRWPVWGGIVSAMVDSIDVILIDLMHLGDFKDYHGTDKILDAYFLVLMAQIEGSRAERFAVIVQVADDLI